MTEQICYDDNHCFSNQPISQQAQIFVMSFELNSLLFFVTGIFLAVLVLWPLFRARSGNLVEQARQEGKAELAVMSERIKNREHRIENLKAELERVIESRDRRIAELQRENTGLRSRTAELETMLQSEKRSVEEKLDLLESARTGLEDTFRALSAEALKLNNKSFLELAGTAFNGLRSEALEDLSRRQRAVERIIQPITEALSKVDHHISDMEKARREAYGSLREQVRSLIMTQESLKSETGKLVKALRSPVVRGRWGEIQLRRVVEMAGMLSHCDFLEQETKTDGRKILRPDLVVKLPGGKNIVVDAKAPLEAYLEASGCDDQETQRKFIARHAALIRKHIRKLGTKAYWKQFEPAPEFVVMFLPGENFFSAALEQDPALIEASVSEQVLLATPTTLIALLRAAAYGWKQEKIAENAEEISRIGRELHERLTVFAGHLSAVGKGLDTAVAMYNRSVGSLETRVLTSARRFSRLGAGSGREIPVLSEVETTARTVKYRSGPDNSKQEE